jgi:periplasmic protein TonB
MTNKEILQADMLDILFEHRNKFYGAYALRKQYNKRLITALGIALSMVSFIIVLTTFRKSNEYSELTVSKDDRVILSPVDLPVNPPEETQSSPERQQPVAEVDYQNIIIVDDANSDDSPDMNAIINAEISDRNIAGPPPDGIQDQDNENNQTLGTNEINQPEAEPNLPSYPPAFPGGEAAWLGFLRKFLQAPEDLVPGERKEVRVRFWIDENGFISRFEIVQSGGSSFDKEVLRVMKKMPKWEPAMQNGRKVAVAFTQPVTFVGVEE